MLINRVASLFPRIFQIFTDRLIRKVKSNRSHPDVLNLVFHDLG